MSAEDTRLLFIYHGGTVPPERAEENIAELWQWLRDLSEEPGHVTNFVANGGKTLISTALGDYDGQIFGISIVEATSLEHATTLARQWPELKYGGRLDILTELPGRRGT